MTVLITKQNADFFLGLNPKLKFQESTKTTCTFKISEKKFTELYNELIRLSVNPYEAMYW
jgi:hypothetical protein